MGVHASSFVSVAFARKRLGMAWRGLPLVNLETGHDKNS